jgi:lysyl-tRNA synthetase class I
VVHEGGPVGGDAWQAAIFSTAAGRGLPPGRAFAAIYVAFLGRPNGPRAGWLLAGLDQDFVAARLREAAAGDATMSPAGGAA